MMLSEAPNSRCLWLDKFTALHCIPIFHNGDRRIWFVLIAGAAVVAAGLASYAGVGRYKKNEYKEDDKT